MGESIAEAVQRAGARPSWWTKARRDAAIDVAALVGLELAVSAFVLASGFSHVSDDDYARVVIAEQWARAPRLDPSGTSWLPFPFWVQGLAMMAFGRSLATARAVAIALGALSVVPPYVAMRAVRMPRVHSLVAVALAACVPWNAWLAVATVPEAMTGALVAAAAIAVGAPRARPLAAAGLMVASLSRYEAWPVCVGFAGICVWGAWREGEAGRLRNLVAAAAALAGPVAWLAWNAHAHGSATHFVTRVASYRQRIGAADVPTLAKWLGYPEALLAAAPEVVALAALAALALTQRETRARWGAPLALGALMLAFLIAGDLRDAAPTHHAARALVALVWLLAAFGVDGARALATRVAWARPTREIYVVIALTAAVIAWAATRPAAWRGFPGTEAWANRDVQIARGRELRVDEGRELIVTPCEYEHFALLAAFGQPERALILPPTHEAITAEHCPRVDQSGSSDTR